jgi:DNA-binding transcriptional regulator YiaG
MDEEFTATNREKLRALMELHSLSSGDVSRMLSVSEHTVLGWRSQGKYPRPMRDAWLELLERKIAANITT